MLGVLLTMVYTLGFMGSGHYLTSKLDEDCRLGRDPTMAQCCWIAALIMCWPAWLVGKVLAAPVQLCLPKPGDMP